MSAGGNLGGESTGVVGIETGLSLNQSSEPSLMIEKPQENQVIARSLPAEG